MLKSDLAVASIPYEDASLNVVCHKGHRTISGRVTLHERKTTTA
jgi:hypothetical protein